MPLWAHDVPCKLALERDAFTGTRKKLFKRSPGDVVLGCVFMSSTRLAAVYLFIGGRAQEKQVFQLESKNLWTLLCCALASAGPCCMPSSGFLRRKSR